MSFRAKCKWMKTVMFKYNDLTLPGERLRHRGCRIDVHSLLRILIKGAARWKTTASHTWRFCPVHCTQAQATAHPNTRTFKNASTCTPRPSRNATRERRSGGNRYAADAWQEGAKLCHSHSDAFSAREQVLTAALMAEFFMRVNAEYT
jgi:hypothetical protein